MDERKRLLPTGCDPVTGTAYQAGCLKCCQQALVYGEDVISIDHRTNFRRCKAVKEKI